MGSSNELYRLTFDGAGWPDFETTWPGFVWPTGNPGLLPPVVDGHGYGISNRFAAARWRGRAQSPGTANYQVEVWGRWNNAGFAGQRELGIIVRYKDFRNLIVARVRSMATDSPELRLFKIVNGTEIQLGSTWTGNPLSATNLNAGMVVCRVVVEDLDDDDGSTRIRVYTSPDGTQDRGDLRIDQTVVVSELRGSFGPGIECGSLWLRDDIRVDNFVVYDTADDPANAEPSEPGTGWKVELDGVLYDVRPDDSGNPLLEGLDPPVEFVECSQMKGSNGGEATFRVKGKALPMGPLHPGQRVRIFHDGDVVFAGDMGKGRAIAAPTETQEFTARSLSWAATQIPIAEDDHSSTMVWNILDRESESYDRDRQETPIGEIIGFLLDRYADELRKRGAAPATGSLYIQSELNAMDAVIYGVAVSGNLFSAIETLRRFMPTFMLFVNPDTKVWEFHNTLNATEEPVVLTSEHATLTVEPDPDKSSTALEWRGVRREKDEDVTLTLADRAWTKAQEDGYTKDKRRFETITVTIVNAGNGNVGDPGVAYADVATGQLHEDDWRGAVATFADQDGRDLGAKWVNHNTSTRIWFDSGWSGQNGVGDPPDPGSRVFMSLVDEQARAELSAAGVGRTFYFPPALICGTTGQTIGLFNRGWCGSVSVSMTGDDGKTFTQPMQGKVNIPTPEQQANGWCPTFTLAEPIKPTIGLVNKLPPPGGSPPKSACEPGGIPSRFPEINVNIKVSKAKEDVPYFRVPEEGYRGTAYSEDETLWDGGGEPKPSDWAVRRVTIIDDNAFVDLAAQKPGILKAANNILALFSQKVFLWEVTIATPWNGQASDPVTVSTSRWAGLQKRITLSSARRTTGFEETENLPVFSVRWLIRENKTIVQAGTPAGWIGGEFGIIAQQFTAKAAAKLMAKTVQAVEDFRNRALKKPVDALGGERAGPIDGCDVTVVDQNTRTVKNVQIDDEQKKAMVNQGALGALANETLFDGAEQEFPGTRPDVPGLSGAEAQQVIDGPVLGSRANHRIPFSGPVAGPNANLGKYGGLTGSENSDNGDPSEILFRKGSFAFRKKPNTAGTSGGGTGLQYAPLGPHGDVAGDWIEYRTARDLPDGKAPLSMIQGSGSTQDQLLERSREMAKALGQVEDQLGKLLAPGDQTEEYPDGAPADLPSHFRVGAMLPAGLRPVTNSWRDPGGLVMQGPMNDNGVDAQMLWRVKAPEMLLVEVERVERGTGTNGGNYDWKQADSGAYVVATRMDIVHKQIDGHDLSDQGNAALRSTIAKADDPFCGVGQQGRVLPTPVGADYAGAGGTLPMPIGATGIPAFLMTVKEDLYGPARGAGESIIARFQYSYQASAWGSIQQTTAAKAAETDGSNTGTGQFKQPGGAVPPGLRSVSLYGNAAGLGNTVIAGLGIEVAVVEKHYYLPLREGVGCGDSLVHSHPWGGEVGGFNDTHALEATKGLSEGIVFGDYVSLEINPRPQGLEGILVGEGVSLELNP